MAIKWAQMFGAMKRLVTNPKDFTDQMKFFEARQEWRVITWGYERMTRGLSQEQQDHLRELTMQPVDMEALARLPKGTFGRAYIDFFRSQNVSATSYMDAWPAMQKVVERSWVVRRSLKLHDMHHVLLNFTCDPFGEMGITAFSVRNHQEPNHTITLLGIPIVAVMFGDPIRTIASVAHGWSLAGRVAQDMFAAPLEEMFELSLDEARRRCNIPVPIPPSVTARGAAPPEEVAVAA